MVRRRVIKVQDNDYDWHVKKTAAGNVLVVSSDGDKPRNIFVGNRNITPGVVSYQIKRFVAGEKNNV